MFNMKDLAPELEEIAAQIRAKWLAPPMEEGEPIEEQIVDALNMKAQHGKWLVPKPKKQAPRCRAWGWELAKRIRPWGWAMERTFAPNITKRKPDSREQYLTKVRLGHNAAKWRKSIDDTYDENQAKVQERLKKYGV